MRIGIAGVGRIGAYHTSTLLGLDEVTEIVLADAMPGRAQEVAEQLGVQAAADPEAMIAAGLDGLVVATATPAHADMIRAGVAAGIPTFCEKPVAATLEESIELAELAAETDVPIQIGFQRRFDAGYRRAHQAVRDGELGVVHTVRAVTLDTAPPPADYVAGSGGLFRDCCIHDFDVIRFVTGREVESVFATGTSRIVEYIAEVGDVDTASGVMTLDDGTIVSFSAARQNGYGHDVRMEVHGTTGDLAVGLDDTLALASAEPGVQFPAGPRVVNFMDRFLPAYQRELGTFTQVAAGTQDSPCTVADGLAAIRIAAACDLSRAEGRVVRLEEIPGAGF